MQLSGQDVKSVLKEWDNFMSDDFGKSSYWQKESIIERVCGICIRMFCLIRYGELVNSK